MGTTYMPATTDALETLGTQIAAARRELGWSMADLAERLGVNVGVIRKIEAGAPSTKAGSLFEAATLTGVPLFGTTPTERALAHATARERLALLPVRIRPSRQEVDDDF